MAWLDQDTLLIGRDWGPGTMSEAGYPITVRKWKRGTPLESAVEVYRGSTKDNGYGNDPAVLVDGQGHRAAVILRNLSTFAHEWYLLLPSGPKKLSLPQKSDIGGLLDNQILVSLDESWTPEGQTKSIPQGAVVSLDLTATQADPVHLKPTVLFAPTSQEFAQQWSTTWILAECGPLLARAGVTPAADYTDEDSRRLRFPTDDPALDVVRVRPFDVATFVAFGAAQLGICGADVLMEFDYPEIYAPLDLGIGVCRVSVAEPAGTAGTDDPSRWSRVRVATKYPNIARRHFAARGVHADVVHLNGAMELAPGLGLSRLIVDLVQTGSTLRPTAWWRPR